MKIKVAFILTTLLFSRAVCFSQNTISFTFLPKFAEATLHLNTHYKIGTKDSLQITALKFYVSGIELWQDQKLIWKEKNSFHLIDISNPKSLSVALNTVNKIKFDEIKFNLGIDSLTNVSGAFGGALDPTLGMYWTWQSGYINFKLEGNSTLCKTRNNEFQFHLGGYLSPFLGLQKIKMKSGSKEKAGIILNIEKIFNSVDLTTQHHIMSPCKESVLLAEEIAKTINTSEH